MILQLQSPYLNYFPAEIVFMHLRCSFGLLKNGALSIKVQ